MNHLWRVIKAFGRQVLFVYSLFFLYSFTGRTSVVLFAMAAYAGRALFLRGRARWIGYAWALVLTGIASLTVAPVDIRFAPGPFGISVEKNGWMYLGTWNPETDEYEYSEEPVGWGAHGCIVATNAPKWMIVVGSGGIGREMAGRYQPYTELVPPFADVDIEGTFLGSYTASSNPDLSPTGLLQLQQTGPAVWGTLTTTLDRTATVSGTIRGADLSLTFRFTDECKGKALGTATITNHGSRLTGDYVANDCLGTYGGHFELNMY